MQVRVASYLNWAVSGEAGSPEEAFRVTRSRPDEQ